MQTRRTQRLDAGEVAWRQEQLAGSGFPAPLASWLARDRRYDLHLLIELVERGCTPELAIRIAAPIDKPEAA
jgi:hypothetical protein